MTAPADKPASLREIYERCDVSNNGTINPLSFDEFVAAITALIPEKQIPYWRSHKGDEIDHARAIGHDEAIDAIHRNFTGQPQGDKEE